MFCIILLILPVAAALLCWKGKLRDRQRLNLTLVTGILHFACSCLAMKMPVGIFRVDMAALVVLVLISLLFALVAIHTRFWYFADLKSRESSEDSGSVLNNRAFTACLLCFLAAMSLAVISDSLGLMWAALAAATPASAPLILFHRSRRSCEAMRKYIVIRSIGIGLALLGILFLAVSANGATLSFTGLAGLKYMMHPGWFKAAFIMAVVGFGTTMGLAPFHTWLPDAHTEAPGTVSALLSTALLNCSFLAIYRMLMLAPDAARDFCMEILVFFGMLSMAVAALAIFRQDNYKRMLAFSTIGHMGLIAIFAGTTGTCDAAWGQMWGHSIIHMSLFLLAGNFLLGCGTRQISRLGGLMKGMPRNAVLFLLGTLMLCGMPPSPLFFTELEFIKHAPLATSLAVAALLFAVFAGMTRNAMALTLGPQGDQKPDDAAAHAAERLIVVPIIALVLALMPFLALVSRFVGHLF